MTEPTFDADGYPTEETLQAIRDWPRAAGMLEFCARAWKWEGLFRRCASNHSEGCPPETIGDSAYDGSEWWEAHTGGWSGNEDIIGAMQDNTMFWIMCWYSSRRGGHYIFEVRK